MPTIKIKDITKSHLAVSAADGALVFTEIDAAFESKEKVTLDFEGITLSITAFLNACIGKLYSKYSSEEVKELLDIQNLKGEEVHLLKLVIEGAKRRFSKSYPEELGNIDLFNED
jgi:hypothetical protein